MSGIRAKSGVLGHAQRLTRPPIHNCGGAEQAPSFVEPSEGNGELSQSVCLAPIPSSDFE